MRDTLSNAALVLWSALLALGALATACAPAQSPPAMRTLWVDYDRGKSLISERLTPPWDLLITQRFALYVMNDKTFEVHREYTVEGNVFDAMTPNQAGHWLVLLGDRILLLDEAHEEPTTLQETVFPEKTMFRLVPSPDRDRVCVQYTDHGNQPGELSRGCFVLDTSTRSIVDITRLASHHGVESIRGVRWVTADHIEVGDADFEHSVVMIIEDDSAAISGKVLSTPATTTTQRE